MLHCASAVVVFQLSVKRFIRASRFPHYFTVSLSLTLCFSSLFVSLDPLPSSFIFLPTPQLFYRHSFLFHNRYQFDERYCCCRFYSIRRLFVFHYNNLSSFSLLSVHYFDTFTLWLEQTRNDTTNNNNQFHCAHTHTHSTLNGHGNACGCECACAFFYTSFHTLACVCAFYLDLSLNE